MSRVSIWDKIAVEPIWNEDDRLPLQTITIRTLKPKEALSSTISISSGIEPFFQRNYVKRLRTLDEVEQD